MNNNIKYWIIIIVSLVLFIAAQNSTKDFFKKIQSLSQIIKLVENLRLNEGTDYGDLKEI